MKNFYIYMISQISGLFIKESLVYVIRTNYAMKFDRVTSTLKGAAFDFHDDFIVEHRRNLNS